MVALPRTPEQSDPIAQVKATVQIVDYAINKMGLRATKQTQNEYWFLCPLHQETTASFHIRFKEQDWHGWQPSTSWLSTGCSRRSR
jgi:hypothetical protein